MNKSQSRYCGYLYLYTCILASFRYATQIRTSWYATSIRRSQYARNHWEGLQTDPSIRSVLVQCAVPGPDAYPKLPIRIVNWFEGTICSDVFLQAAAVSNDCVVFWYILWATLGWLLEGKRCWFQSLATCTVPQRRFSAWLPIRGQYAVDAQSKRKDKQFQQQRPLEQSLEAFHKATRPATTM